MGQEGWGGEGVIEVERKVEGRCWGRERKGVVRGRKRRIRRRGMILGGGIMLPYSAVMTWEGLFW